MISFRKFWCYLDDNNITQYQLITHYGINNSILDRLRNNALISTSTIALICDALNCQPGDIMENLPADQVEKKEQSPRGRKKKQNIAL